INADAGALPAQLAVSFGERQAALSRTGIAGVTVAHDTHVITDLAYRVGKADGRIQLHIGEADAAAPNRSIEARLMADRHAALHGWRAGRLRHATEQVVAGEGQVGAAAPCLDVGRMSGNTAQTESEAKYTAGQKRNFHG